MADPQGNRLYVNLSASHNACEQVAKLLELKQTDPEGYCRQMLSYNHLYCRRWER